MRRSWWGRGVVVAALVSLMTAGVAAPAAVAAPRAAEVVSAAKANRPPSRPTKVRFTSPNQAACATGAARPSLRGPDVRLSAVLSDPDGGNVASLVEVRRLYRPNALVWKGATAPQASGRSQTTVVDGLPVGSYRLRIAGRDARGEVGPYVTCDFAVSQAPLAAPTVTPLEGYPGFYPDGGQAPGPNREGGFRFGAGGTDVVEYQYSWGAQSFTSAVPAADPTITYTPREAGPHRLYVRSVAADGRTSPTTSHFFFVDTGRVRFLFDDQANPTLSVDGGAALTVSPSTAWVPGPLAELGFADEDGALHFDEPGDEARSDGAIIDPTDAFTVSATVRVDAGAGAQASAVVMGGAGGSASLGRSACADGSGSCWSFEVTDAEGAGAAVVASAKVSHGEWTHVFGVVDPDRGLAEVFSCSLGDFPSDGVAVATGRVRPDGPVTVGSGASGSWQGSVADVSLVPGRISDGDALRSCMGLLG